MDNLPLDLLLPPPDYTARGILEISALSPLSMVAKMPGKYYASQSEPTQAMLLGALENALGWHLGEVERNQLIKTLEKKHKHKAQASGVGFRSLLQWHVRFGVLVVPPLLYYDDLWTQHLKGKTFVDGSRNYDAQAIPFMNAKRGGLVTTSDAAKARKGAEVLADFQEGDEVSITVLRPYFPQYYSSPTLRGYVEPQGPYRVGIETSPALAEVLRAAIADPAAPLYLGSNDGWIELDWHE
ncbi:hypothetical protein [Hymenobacter cheonanensis]|uniref:hypothetical protein n=1 Tax=Hymenobacter sp. CA2-7 TaxID=3063993 RepID=UPI0027125B46|nr:hypothetical protein [Hymenobacter sp. CA2-7]MDO7886912.1 hypothetical protein [Hymenobacter sp. CA2-7]